MNRRGFALFTAVWLLAVLATIAGVAVAGARRTEWAAMNRIALRRGRWAAEGCLALVTAESPDSTSPALDSVDLGSGTWCRVRRDDPEARLNVNTAPESAITAALESPALAAALLDWRDTDQVARAGGAERDWYLAAHRLPPRDGPLAAVPELRLVRGFDDALVRRAASLLTARGPGRVNVNAAPAAVLVTLPGFTPYIAQFVLEHRAAVGPFADLDGLVYALPPDARTSLLGAYAELRQATVFTPEILVAHIEGHAPESPAVCQMVVTLVPAGTRWAVVRRELW